MIEKIKTRGLRILAFFRIIDPEDNNISLTNMIVTASIFVLLKAETADFSQVAALLTAVVAYTSKKVLVGKKKKDKEADMKAMKELDEKQSTQINKLEDEVKILKSIVSSATINQTFRR